MLQKWYTTPNEGDFRCTEKNEKSSDQQSFYREAKFIFGYFQKS